MLHSDLRQVQQKASQCIASLPRVMQSCDNSFIGFVGAGLVEMSATAMGPPLSYFVCSCWLRYLHEGCGLVAQF